VRWVDLETALVETALVETALVETALEGVLPAPMVLVTAAPLPSAFKPRLIPV